MALPDLTSNGRELVEFLNPPEKPIHLIGLQIKPGHGASSPDGLPVGEEISQARFRPPSPRLAEGFRVMKPGFAGHATSHNTD